jgi:ribosomal protein S18 acetylase RimI-like enzyme
MAEDMKIKIEEAKRKDINSIVKLQMGLADYHKKIDFKYYKSGRERKEKLRKRLLQRLSKKRRNSKFLVAKIRNQVVGFFIGGIHKSWPYCREKKIGEIYQAYVDRKFRKKGIGKLLFQELLKWFKKRKIKFIEVEVDSRNEIGISAWKKYGFFEFQKKMRLNL